MRKAHPLAIGTTLTLLLAGMPHALAQQTPYYNPTNAASSSGLTIGHELYRTIGCPGRGILDTPCPTPASAPAPAAPKPAPVAPPLDSDGDGVIDDRDRCPGTPAGAKVDARGCELDSDGDGVVDRLDRCPDTPAGAKVDARGCELDSDGDGVVDRLDQCPDTPSGATVDDKGCPPPMVIELPGVSFDYDKATLRPDAVFLLESAVTTLQRNPGLKVEVAGHTDSVGGDEYNLDLSERRARAVMDYFISQGINADNLTAKGYGKSQPIADNETDAGRASNRRVELRIQN